MLKSKFINIVVSMSLVFTSALSIVSPQPASAASRDCDSNAIVYCGAMSVDELKTRYHQNKTGDIKLIYSKFGITERKNFNKVQSGLVYKDGRVVVNGKLVATGAKSVGRQHMNGSWKLAGTNVYMRPVGVSFRSDALEAFVKMKDGKFQWAVLKACGNPVKATPIKVEKPKPEAKFECKDLSAQAIGKPKERTYKFTAKSMVKNAKVETYNFDFGDGKSKKSKDNKVTHKYAKPGKYTATVRINTNKGTTAITNICKVKITIQKTPNTPDVIEDVVQPPKEQTIEKGLPGKLANTGPGAAMAGFAGSSGLGMAIRSYLKSRKDLVDSLLDA